MLSPGTTSGPPPPSRTPAAARPRSAEGAPALAMLALAALVVSLQFGPLIGLVGFRLSENPIWSFNGAARDALVLLLFGLAVQARLGRAPGADPGPGRRTPASVRWALVLVGALAVMALASPSAPLVTALNLRRLLLVPLLFLALWWMPWRPRQIDRALGWIFTSLVAVAAFGAVERHLPDTFWTEWLQIEPYAAANGFDRFGFLPFQHSGRYYSSDLSPWLEQPIRRSIASYLEPTTLAAAMATLLVMAQARRARGHAAGLALGLALLCGLGTVSKGFALFLLLLLLWRSTGLPSPRQLLLLGFAGCALALAATRWQLEGSLQHLGGLTTGLENLLAGQWLGEGLGAAGNYTNEDVSIGDESGLGNALAQIGWLAFIPLLWVAALARDVLRAASRRRDAGGPWLASWLVFWTVTYLFSASSLGVGGNALGFAALALYLHPASEPHRGVR